MSTGLRFDKDAVCDTCGRYGAYLLDGERLCAECYEKRGSCCLEFGSDDLWREKSESNKSDEPAGPSPPTSPPRKT